MHTTYEPAPPPPPVPLPGVARAMVAGFRRVRAHPVLNPTAFEESWRERAGHAVDPDHRPHLVAALDWLGQAQDATGQGGIARGYSLGWNPFFGSRAWQPADPGATGDIIPVLYVAARHLHRPELAERAEQAARWELELQLPSGAVRRGVVGERTASATFTTGRVLLAWLAAIGGLLEGGRVLGDAGLIARATSATARVARAVDPAGRVPGRLAIGWRPAASWDSLAGVAQMANIWLRLHEITRDRQWLEPVDVVLRFLKSTQNRTTQDPGVRGGLKASFPVGAGNDSYQVLSSATAGFAESLIRDERRRAGISPLAVRGAA